jgi:hypothetical protein
MLIITAVQLSLVLRIFVQGSANSWGQTPETMFLHLILRRMFQPESQCTGFVVEGSHGKICRKYLSPLLNSSIAVLIALAIFSSDLHSLTHTFR